MGKPRKRYGFQTGSGKEQDGQRGEKDTGTAARSRPRQRRNKDRPRNRQPKASRNSGESKAAKVRGQLRQTGCEELQKFRRISAPGPARQKARDGKRTEREAENHPIRRS